MLEFELVLPCYNEAKSLTALVQRAVNAAEEAGYGPERFQLVLVENGSRDNSSQIMDELQAGPWGQWFRKVKVDANQGYGFGILSGLRTTSAKWIGWSHADQQCDPKDAFRALERVKQNSSDKCLVKGTRSGRGWKDILVTRIFEILALLILRMRLQEINAQPKVFPRTLLTKLQSPPYTFAFDLYVLYVAKKEGFAFVDVPVLFPPRSHGVSNWAASFAGRWKTMMGMIHYMWLLSREN